MGVSKISLISLVNTSYGLYFHEKPTLLRDLEIRGCRVAWNNGENNENKQIQ